MFQTALNAFFLDPEGSTAQDEVQEISAPQSVPAQPPTLQEIAAGGPKPGRGQQQSRLVIIIFTSNVLYICYITG